MPKTKTSSIAKEKAVINAEKDAFTKKMKTLAEVSIKQYLKTKRKSTNQNKIDYRKYIPILELPARRETSEAEVSSERVDLVNKGVINMTLDLDSLEEDLHKADAIIAGLISKFEEKNTTKSTSKPDNHSSCGTSLSVKKVNPAGTNASHVVVIQKEIIFLNYMP